MRIAKNERFIMMGDSVTDVGRARPFGEGRLTDAYGGGYPCLTQSMLDCDYPERAIRVINMGVSGDTVRSLKARWQRDVLDLSPDWVSVMIGINDVWRQFDSPKMPELHVLPAEFEATLEELVRIAKPRVKGIVLITPVYMDANRQDPMRARRDEYAEIVSQVAARNGTLLADPQPAFDRLFTHFHPMSMSWDYVHPNLTGHMLIARELLRVLEA